MKNLLILCGAATIIIFTVIFISIDLSKPKISAVGPVIVEAITTHPPETEIVLAANIPEPVLLDSAKLIYNYYYEDSQESKTISVDIPYFLVGMSRSQLTSYFQGWTLDSYSPEKIVIKKSIKETPESYYILGIHNGYVAVFYGAPNSGEVKEITSTPVSSLDPSEQKRLQEGIEIIGESRLFKALESYEG